MDTINETWKRNLLVAGALFGALIGASTAYLMLRTAEEHGTNTPPTITTGDAIRTALGIIGTMRGVAALGKGKG